jgi:hypothetical protein
VVVNFIRGIAAEVAVWGDINLTADNGLYSRFYGFQIKLDGAVHYSVVGYRQAGHTKLFGALHKVGDAAHAVKEAVLGMDMEMAEHG